MGKPVDTETFVYVMARKNADGLSGPCKVGITSGLDGRLEQIRTASPFDVKLAAWFSFPTRSTAREVEHAFHAVKKELRLHGEWFDVEPKKLWACFSRQSRHFLKCGSRLTRPPLARFGIVS